MASEAENVRPKLVQGIDRLCTEYRKILDTSTRLLPFRGGASLTQPDFNLMGITIIDAAKNNFWKAPDAQTKAGLKSGLEGTLRDVQSSLDDYRKYKEELAESRSPTMAIAYNVSRIYIACLHDLLEDGLFHNEALLDESEDGHFQNLGISYFRTYIDMETHVAFVTPRQPHVTIISVQPQLAPSQRELLCTEIWTLYYWANKLISRALHVTGHYLPMRLVSLCGYEARILSAVFTPNGDQLSTVKEKGHGNHQIMGCRIHIGVYIDLSTLQGFQRLMEELVATPWISANVKQKSPGQQNA